VDGGKNALAQERLNALGRSRRAENPLAEAAGIVTRRRDPEHAHQVIYEPTGKGLDLLPSMLEMVRWSAKYDPRTEKERSYTIKVTPPSCRVPAGQSASSPQPYPGREVHSRFRHRLDTFQHFISGSLAFISSIRT
jgi:hypothetical protein